MAVIFLGYWHDLGFLAFQQYLMQTKELSNGARVSLEHRPENYRRVFVRSGDVTIGRRAGGFSIAMITEWESALEVAKTLGIVRHEGRVLVTDAILVATARKSQIKTLTDQGRLGLNGYTIVKNDEVPELSDMNRAVLIHGRPSIGQMVEEAMAVFVIPSAPDAVSRGATRDIVLPKTESLPSCG